MGINFPASPTLNQKWPQPAVAGIPVYTWDGEKWTTVGGSIAAYAPPADAVPLVNAGAGLVGTSTDYAREDHVHPTDASLLAYSGMQINGGMEVSQEHGPGIPMTTDGYILDGWTLSHGGSMAVSAIQVNAIGLSGFPSHLALSVTAAQTTLGATDYAEIYQHIEGYRIARLGWGAAGAQPITVSFWTCHHRTGIYSVSITTSDWVRMYAATYTQNAADTWEYKTVTVTGDVAGTWWSEPNNLARMTINFIVACGSGAIASSINVWVAGSYLAAPGQVNGVAATSDVFRITGVTVLPGTQAPTAAQSPNIMRPYDQELVTCQRYWRKIGGQTANDVGITGYTLVSNWLSRNFPLTPGMRAAPTVAKVGTFSDSNVSASSFVSSRDNVLWQITAGSSNPASSLGNIGSITFDARL